MSAPGYKSNRSSWLPVIAAALLLLAPLVTQDPYHLSVLIVIGLYTLVGAGLCLLMGHAGQVSLGQAGFYGLGAYTSGLLSVKAGVSPWLGLVAGMLIAAGAAYLLGYLTLKLHMHYLALATLGFGIIVYIVFVEWIPLTGGPSGLRAIPYLSVGDFNFAWDEHFYFLVWGSVLIGLFLYRNLVHSRIGRALQAVHGSEYAAEALGVDVATYKIQVFALSAAYAGLAGGLYAHWITFISPTAFGLVVSIHFVIIGVVGGLSSVWGPLLGAGLVIWLKEVLHDVVPALIPTARGEYEIIFFGVLVVLVLIFMPQGLGGTLDRVIERLTARRSQPATTKGGGD